MCVQYVSVNCEKAHAIISCVTAYGRRGRSGGVKEEEAKEERGRKGSGERGKKRIEGHRGGGRKQGREGKREKEKERGQR